ncbi:hypothetical protein O181_090247 [Austropuccinia psidii MF-1]|uniref:Uncharacterized protein n=1 Tax=Austropuccinia psidii MF-1 TaxID=1389203 RepID=A0A9Q3IV60_9BASI|nr:hypothetical protein [Austropuccinia psidii MF-1]
MALNPLMIGGGTRIMVMARFPRTPLGDKRTPQAQKKLEAWGLGIWKLDRKANDGRIWTEAINDDWAHERPGKGAMAKGPVGHKRYGVANWPQLGSRLNCHNTHGGGSFLMGVTHILLL